MRYRMLLFVAMLALPMAAPAGDPPKGDPPKGDPPTKDYADLSKLIHKMVVKQVPREHEEKFDWFKSIPIPPRLAAPNLPRTYVKTGDKKELAHGNWKRIVVRLDNPDKDLKIKVKEFAKQDKGGYRVVIDAEATVRCDGEMKQWLRGLLLLQLDGKADATITSSMVCDVDVKINLKKFPPEVLVDPKILEMTLDLKNFNLTQVGGSLEGEKIRQIGNDLMPDLIRGMMKSSEPMIKDYANKAIAQSLKESKGALSATELLKAAPKDKDKKESPKR
jgi:hypothetical protein